MTGAPAGATGAVSGTGRRPARRRFATGGRRSTVHPARTAGHGRRLAGDNRVERTCDAMSRHGDRGRVTRPGVASRRPRPRSATSSSAGAGSTRCVAAREPERHAGVGAGRPRRFTGRPRSAPAPSEANAMLIRSGIDDGARRRLRSAKHAGVSLARSPSKPVLRRGLDPPGHAAAACTPPPGAGSERPVSAPTSGVRRSTLLLHRNSLTSGRGFLFRLDP